MLMRTTIFPSCLIGTSVNPRPPSCFLKCIYVNAQVFSPLRERHALLHSAVMLDAGRNKKMLSCIVTVLSIPSSPIKVEKAL